MVDTVALSAGTADGAVIATDDIAGVHYQLFKYGYGALDTFVLAVAGNGAVTTGTQRVTIASDSTGNIATIGTSVTPGTAAGNLGKAEDAAHSSGDTGVMLLAVREATATDLSVGNTDGDYEPLQVDANGRLHVNAGTVTVASHAVTNAGTFVVQENGAALTSLQLIDDVVIADDAAFTPASTKVLMAGFEFDDVAPDSVDEGDSGAGRMSANRSQYIQIRDAAGNERGVNVNASNQMAIAGPVTVASAGIASGAIASGAIASGAVASGAIASGAVASGAYASGALAAGSIATGAIADMLVDDAAFTPATSRVMPAGFEADETATDSVDEGDVGAARMTLDRKQIITQQGHTAGGLTTAMFSGSDGSSILVATSQVVKASAGQLYGYYAYNPETAVSFVHFYNTASASVTVGTTNPLFTIAIPGGSAANLAIPQGITFSNAGWSVAATTTAGGNTAPATGVSLTVWYM